MIAGPLAPDGVRARSMPPTAERLAVTCERGGVDHRTYEPISGPGRSRPAASLDRRASPSAQSSGRVGGHSERLPTVAGGTRVTPVLDGVRPTGRRRESSQLPGNPRGDPSSCRSSTRAAAVTSPAARRRPDRAGRHSDRRGSCRTAGCRRRSPQSRSSARRS